MPPYKQNTSIETMLQQQIEQFAFIEEDLSISPSSSENGNNNGMRISESSSCPDVVAMDLVDTGFSEAPSTSSISVIFSGNSSTNGAINSAPPNDLIEFPETPSTSAISANFFINSSINGAFDSAPPNGLIGSSEAPSTSGISANFFGNLSTNEAINSAPPNDLNRLTETSSTTGISSDNSGNSSRNGVMNALPSNANTGFPEPSSSVTLMDVAASSSSAVVVNSTTTTESLWTLALKLPEDGFLKVQEAYSEHFPLDLRHCLAPWLESRDWTQKKNDNFLFEIVDQLKRVQDLMRNSPEPESEKAKFQEAALKIICRFWHNPNQLYLTVRRLLKTEMEIIQRTEAARDTNEVLMIALQAIQRQVEEVPISQLRSAIETFQNIFHQYQEWLREHNNVLNNPGISNQRQLHEEDLSNRVQRISQILADTVKLIKKNIGLLYQIQTKVLEELNKWKREQQLNGNSLPMFASLDAIQRWCELLAKMSWSSRRQTHTVADLNMIMFQNQNLTQMLNYLDGQVMDLISTLLKSTFVIEKQPPQVLKTNNRFQAACRLLVGGELLQNIQTKVKVTIISEQQAELISKGCDTDPDGCGKIINNTNNMVYDATSRQFRGSFRNMQLSDLKRPGKKNIYVAEEKLRLLFQATLKFAGIEDIHVWTLSLPIVVIVHTKQEQIAWATITWDNAFRPQQGTPFQAPDEVTWQQLAETLRIKFLSQTGGDLSEENLHFLAEKLFRTSLPQNQQELNAKTVSWGQFAKENLPGRDFTFWEWFSMVVRLTREFLAQLWCDGLIVGFMQKKQAEEILSRCATGTFLLRFSESTLGGITIAWTGENNKVSHLQPLIAKNLTERALPDALGDMPHLETLYPNPDSVKVNVFGKYYSQPVTGKEGDYVPLKLVISVL